VGASISVNSGPNGYGILTGTIDVEVSLADVGGGSPTAWAWAVTAWPPPLGAPPTLTGATTSSASFTPAVDGTYQVTLIRTEAGGVVTTTQSVLIGVQDTFGYVLPSPGVDAVLYATVVPLTSTTVASGSNGANLPQSTIDVANTAQFPASGTATLTELSTSITFTGKTGTTLTGCAGGTGTLATGQHVVLAPSTAQQRAAIAGGSVGSSAGGTDVGLDAELRAIRASAGSGSPTGPAAGSLAGNYPDPTLAASGVTAGTYGSSTSVPVVAVGADGRVTSATSAPIAAPARPANDQYGIIEYRFNELVEGVLVNHGSYGAGTSGSLGPAPTTLTAGFTQPAVGSTVTASVASTAGFTAGQFILVGARGANGAGANYYYLASVGSGTLTLKNLGISGGTYVSPSSTVGANGTAVTAVLDILAPGTTGDNYINLVCEGPFDYCQSVDGTDNACWTNYGQGSGGFPDLSAAALTEFSIHLLIFPRANAQYAEWFGYSHAQSWTAYAADFRIFGNDVADGTWGFTMANQAFSGSLWFASYQGGVSLNAWQLLSVTVNLTTGAIAFYKNGVACGTASTGSTSNTLAIGSTGFLYVLDPGSNSGDSGDLTNAQVAWLRFDITVRTAAQIAAIYQSIKPAAANWPVP
jgi:hypothetical protein